MKRFLKVPFYLSLKCDWHHFYTNSTWDENSIIYLMMKCAKVVNGDIPAPVMTRNCLIVLQNHRKEINI